MALRPPLPTRGSLAGAISEQRGGGGAAGGGGRRAAVLLVDLAVHNRAVS